MDANTDNLVQMTLSDLKSLAKKDGVKGFSKMSKQDLIESLRKSNPKEIDQNQKTCDEKKSDDVKSDVVKPRSVTLSEDDDKINEFLKKMSKTTMIEHAVKMNIHNSSKLSKRDLLDSIIEQIVIDKLKELSMNV